MAAWFGIRLPTFPEVGTLLESLPKPCLRSHLTNVKAWNIIEFILRV
jgi:hypothetical protein